MSVVSVTRTDFLIQNNFFEIRSKNSILFADLRTFSSKAHDFYKNDLLEKSVRATELQSFRIDVPVTVSVPITATLIILLNSEIMRAKS